MPDLTLSEYDGLSTEDLERKLQQERNKIYVSDSLEYDFGEASGCLLNFYQQMQEIISLFNKTSRMCVHLFTAIFYKQI